MKKDKIKSRPVLNLTGNSKTEDFQNKILRPIIKLQQYIIIEIFKSQCKKYHIALEKISIDELPTKIEAMTKNTVTRNLLLGIIIGMFTKEEYIQYSQKSTEYNKRIITMIVQRLKSSLNEIS